MINPLFDCQRQYQLALELRNLGDESYIPSGDNLYGRERSASMKLTMDF